MPPKDKLEKLWAAIVDQTQDENMYALGLILLSQIHKQTGFWPAGFEVKMDEAMARLKG